MAIKPDFADKVYSREQYISALRVLIHIKDEESAKLYESGYEAGKLDGYREGVIDTLKDVVEIFQRSYAEV